LQGHYIFADYCTDSVWTLSNNAGNWDLTHQGAFTGNNFSSFGEDAEGEIYVAGSTSGKIFHIIDTGTPVVVNKGPEDEILISPNPASGTIHVKRLYNSKGEADISIIDPTGVLVFRSKMSGPEESFNLEHLKPGLYILFLNGISSKGCKIVLL
jgi:hypothetical protein